MAELLYGKPVAASLDEKTKAHVEELKLRDIKPCLAVVRVGEDPDNMAYEKGILKKAETLGIEVALTKLDGKVTEQTLAATLESINTDPKIHGCLLFRPLPAHIDELKMCNTISQSKDVDGIGAESLAGVFMGLNEGFAPATAQACVAMLDFYNIPIEGKHVAIIGRSLVVGKPAAMLLLERDATVTLCHSKSQDVPAVSRNADIVICATGRAKMFSMDYFSEGQTVLDVGINMDESGQLCGDVCFQEVEQNVSALTPVPGGVGSVTTSILLNNVVAAARRLTL